MEGISEVGGIRLRYRIEGDGPWLALIHGVGSRLEAWDGVIAALGGRWRTLRYDLRGHGGSAKPKGPYRLADFVRDLEGLLDAQGVERCHLAGFSLGGLVAQGFALARPERLDRLVLLSTVAGRSAEERERVQARLALVAGGIPGAHFERSVARWFTDEFREAHPEIIAAHAAQNRENDPAAYAAAYRVLAESDLGDRLHEIKAATLIATGENDLGSNPRMARLMHARIAGSRLEILPHLRHSILIEAPDAVAGLMAPFLTGRD
ncbi:MAG TPA: alpha/beta fold hydrolase [Alphaproteobacteria bacterium]|nr:alpha/beta fold hydrolase [Alphaproteobacteria bacterium]